MVREAHLRTGYDRRGRTTRGEPKPAGTSDKGAALVEMALTITLLVMLLVGVVTSAIALGRDNSIQNAAREASRFAATLPEADANLDDIIGVARAAASGDLDASVPNDQICAAFVPADYDPSDAMTTQPTRRIAIDGVLGPVESDWCFDDGRTGNDEARVQVIAQRDSSINAIVFTTNVTLKAQAAARYER